MLVADTFLPTFEYLATAVILLDEQSHITYLNSAAENLFALSSKSLIGYPIQHIFTHTEQLTAAMQHAVTNNASYIEHDLMLGMPPHGKLHLRCAATPLQLNNYLLLEFHTIDRSLKLAREEQMLDQTQANRLLLRNLAHEIKNPLGGIRGAAQLLEHELEKPGLREYTQVVIQETDRLVSLMEKLLTPQHKPNLCSSLNIHEVLERVRSVVLAEFPEKLSIRRDYDISLPVLTGDKEQLIQAILNLVRNAAQSMQGQGNIVLRTRISRQITLMRKRHRLALIVQVIDDGPGIPVHLQDKIFYPLVTGRDNGHGLGLTLAQDFVSQHEGSIEFDSEPGRTCFSVMLPLK
ncbi:MAG: nitrogen regulation protein NR(II) [Candidatus Nitrotoga sp.]|nr:nitrogen regulation protein NR(II) [Candidatus Nitrotoga sp.]MDP1855283.1 nitrogen regulation protein NR(II) [Candidatus Nitrotoga sp.]